MKHLVILLLSISFSCSNSQQNGLFCADIERYNPKTGKESTYRSVINVDNNILREIYFPNGGHTDDEDFGLPQFLSRVVSFSDKRNVQFKISIVSSGSDCFDGFSPLKQCSGITKKGHRCKNMTGKDGSRCWMHKKN